MLQILSWNIRQGGGSRLAKIIDSIIASKAHIIILSEFRNNARGATLRYRLLQIGFKHQLVADATGNTNTVMIASKLSFNGCLFPKSDPDYPNNVIAARFDAFSLYGVYLPHKKKHTLFPFLLSQITNEVPSILAGDLNSGINGIDQKGSSFWYSEYFDLFEEAGYIDAFRHHHGDIKQYSWYSHRGNGYRYDHTIIHNLLVPLTKDCIYLHEVREANVSDHSPMLLTIS